MLRHSPHSTYPLYVNTPDTAAANIASGSHPGGNEAAATQEQSTSLPLGESPVGLRQRKPPAHSLSSSTMDAATARSVAASFTVPVGPVRSVLGAPAWAGPVTGLDSGASEPEAAGRIYAPLPPNGEVRQAAALGPGPVGEGIEQLQPLSTVTSAESGRRLPSALSLIGRLSSRRATTGNDREPLLPNASAVARPEVDEEVKRLQPTEREGRGVGTGNDRAETAASRSGRMIVGIISK